MHDGFYLNLYMDSIYIDDDGCGVVSFVDVLYTE